MPAPWPCTGAGQRRESGYDYRMTKRIRTLVVLVLLTVAVVWWYRSDHAPAPDQRLVRHIDALCEIARTNVDTPREGVDAWFGFLAGHSPDIFSQFGELLVVIERIPDDDAHDARARTAAKRLHTATSRCSSTFERFLAAVERDPVARKRFERGTERLGRTLEILFGSRSDYALPFELSLN